MQEDEDLPPFWFQTTDTPRRRRHQPRRTGSFFLNSSLLLIILVVIAAVLIFIIVPYVVSFTSQIFRPQLVKKSWDSLNLVLVLFAIVCGFLSRNNGGDNANYYPENRVLNGAEDVQRSNLRQWYDHDQYSDRPANGSLSRLRSSSSYPDLRQESPWVSGGYRWRFSDDTQVDNYRVIGSDQVLRRRQHLEPENVEVNQKEVSVSYTPPPPSSPPPPSPGPSLVLPHTPPPKVVRRRPKQASQSLGRKRKAENEENNDSEVRTSQPPSPPPPPPPPPVPVFEEIEQKSGRNEKKRGGATKDFLTSFYNQPKEKKKQRQKSVENLDSLFNSEPSSSTLHPPQSAAPPPPPPPPPHSVFHSLFSSKKGKTKTKKTHSVPPPPPPSQISTARASKSTSQFDPITTHNQKPLFPVKVSNYSIMDENVNLGNESPLNTIPPPPQPPFKMPAWRFVVHGDYVRLKSFNSASSRSGSPDIDEAEDLSSKESSPMARSAPAMDGGDSRTALFCPSPDVDTKADSFIARFRAGLKLEKMDSMEEKRGRGRSNLGQDANPRPET